MQVAVIKSYGGLNKIEYVTLKQPVPDKNELLIEVKAFGLNPKDILVRKGKFKSFSGKKFPQHIGFEFAGIVIKVPASSRFKTGDKVFGMYNGWQGRCSSEYICIVENLIWSIPLGISIEQASGTSLTGMTALQALRDIGKIKPNYQLCINGASGGVGTQAIQIGRLFSAKITAITSYRNKGLCQSLGADNIVDYTKENILESKQKFDIFFDVYGNYNFNKIKGCLTKSGIYITTVPTSNIFKQKIFNLFRYKKAQLVIVKSKQKDLQWLASQIENNKLTTIIDKVYSFDEIKQGQQYIETKRAKGKVIITI